MFDYIIIYECYFCFQANEAAHFVDIGVVTSIESNHKSVENARRGQEVCVKIEPTGDGAPKMFGRHFDEKDFLLSKVSKLKLFISPNKMLHVTMMAKRLSSIFITYSCHVVLCIAMVAVHWLAKGSRDYGDSALLSDCNPYHLMYRNLIRKKCLKKHEIKNY